MNKILIIEDDTRVAELIKRSLEELDYVVTVAQDGSLGKNLALNKDFQLIITDVVLPKISGIELCKELKKSIPETPIIMLTALGTTDDKMDGFDAGADDYLVKPFDLRELHARIRVLLKRNDKKTNLQDQILKHADLVVNIKTKIVTRNNIEINLTPKEFNLLEYMINNSDRVLSRSEIAEKVWNTHFDTGTNFIDVYIITCEKK